MLYHSRFMVVALHNKKFDGATSAAASVHIRLASALESVFFSAGACPLASPI